MGRVVHSRKLIGLVAVLTLGLGLPAAALALRLRANRAPTTKASTSPAARPTAGAPELGALFVNASTELHDCTASVVDSPRGDVLLTAAHCVSGTGVGMVFAPGLRDGIAPEGHWVVTGAYLPSGWLHSQDEKQDFAFLVVAPQQIDGVTREIQQVTGGFPLGATPRSGSHVTVSGYPGGSTNSPIACTAKVYLTHGYPSFDCHGFVGGTSGSPWLRSSVPGQPIVGVIGGLHQGGCVDSTSYSSPLGAAARTVYERAATGARADRAPAPHGDGCT